jgi:deoxyribose-phosphate aldolase
MNTELSDLLAQADLLETEISSAGQQPNEPMPAGGDLSRWIDHTLLKPEAVPQQIEQLCAEARQYHFASVCVNAIYVPLAARLLRVIPRVIPTDTPQVAVCAVVGFPLGAVPAEIKRAETEWCLNAGAREIDMVIPVGLLKGGEYAQVLEHIRAVCQAAHPNAIVKVILEMAFLSQREKIIGCLLGQMGGVDFVKTSTGFGPSGATIEDVSLMWKVVGNGSPYRLGIKAAGGVRSLQDAAAMIKAGATRLGSSSGLKIMQQALAQGG